MSAASSHPLEDLFTAFWAAVDARVLNMLDREVASNAFLSSLLECLVFMIRRITASSSEEAISLLLGKPGEEVVDVDRVVQAFLEGQLERTWEELSSSGLKINANNGGTEMAKMFASLYRLRPGMFQKQTNISSSRDTEQNVLISHRIFPGGMDSIGEQSHRFHRVILGYTPDHYTRTVASASNRPRAGHCSGRCCGGLGERCRPGSVRSDLQPAHC